MGLEAEFSLNIDGRSRRPERVFGDPRAFLGSDLMHRRGTSYHLSTGGAVYFDTGVIEVATPAMEIERGCAAWNVALTRPALRATTGCTSLNT